MKKGVNVSQHPQLIIRDNRWPFNFGFLIADCEFFFSWYLTKSIIFSLCALGVLGGKRIVFSCALFRAWCGGGAG